MLIGKAGMAKMGLFSYGVDEQGKAGRDRQSMFQCGMALTGRERIGMARQANMGNPETRLHAAVVRYVRTTCPECRIWHPANGGKRSKETARLMAALGVERGTPDLVLMGPNRIIGFIEVKHGDNKLTDEQDSFRIDCVKWGFPFVIVRSLDDIRDFIIQNGIPNRLAERESLQAKWDAEEAAKMTAA